MKRWLLLVALWVVPASVQATEWHALAGVQSTNKGRQVIAFLPNELWVHAGDSVTWHFFSDEIHTVSFLIPGQIRPTYLAGCRPALHETVGNLLQTVIVVIDRAEAHPATFFAPSHLHDVGQLVQRIEQFYAAQGDARGWVKPRVVIGHEVHSGGAVERFDLGGGLFVDAAKPTAIDAATRLVEGTQA